jgi:LysR family transcriptional regulator, chromosome initiation inhibitor
MLDYSLLAALAAVVREGSFERAARVLHVTPSAVSQRVRLLEERIGQVLVVRGTPCSATAAGRRLVRHAEDVMLLEDALRPELGGALPRPTLRVAVNADSLATWFVPAAAAFTRASGALLDLHIDDQDHTAGWLRNGEVVAAVCALADPVQGCRSTPLGVLRYVAAATPDFVARHFTGGVSSETLAAAPCLVFNRKDRLQAQWIERTLGHAVETPNHWLPDSHAFVAACRAGIGWGLHPEAMVHAALAAGALVPLTPGPPLDVPLHWQASRLAAPLIEALTSAVLAAAREALAPAGPLHPDGAEVRRSRSP